MNRDQVSFWFIQYIIILNSGYIFIPRKCVFCLIIFLLSFCFTLTLIILSTSPSSSPFPSLYIRTIIEEFFQASSFLFLCTNIYLQLHISLRMLSLSMLFVITRNKIPTKWFPSCTRKYKGPIGYDINCCT